MPVLPSRAITRRALLSRLDDAIHRPLTLVTSPAGFGKSVLVARWCRERCSLPVAWITIGRHDVAARVVDKLIDALHDLTNSERPSHHRSATEATGLDAETVDVLIELMAGAPDCVVVIDDVNRKGSVDAVADLALVLENPRNTTVHLIAVGRHAPTPATLPLRLRGKAAHVGAVDLALSAAETAEVVESYAGVALSAEMAQRLAARLEGWTAGAVIVGMTHPGSPECTLDELIDAAFEDIDSYVTAEIVSPLPAELQRFVRLTACVDEALPALCDAMTGRSDSERLLNSLRLAGAPIKRRRSRASEFVCLRPVREVLDAHAKRDDPAGRATALRLAADWLADHGRPLAAADCLARAGDLARMATVVTSHLARLGASDEFGAFVDLARETIMHLPPPQVVQVRGMRATNLVLAGRAGEAVEEARIGITAATDAGLLEDDSSADVLYALAEARRLTLEDDHADTTLRQSETIAARNARRHLVSAIVASRANRLIDAGDARSALNLIARHNGTDQKRSKTVAALLAAAEARALAVHGQPRQALDVLDGAPATAATASARVVIALAAGDLGAAQETVAGWPSERSVNSSVRRSLGLAVLSDASGDRVAAARAFGAALRTAADHQLAQPFIEFGPVISRLLRGVGGDAPESVRDLVDRIQARISTGSIFTVAPRFTAREAQVLSHLVEGMSLAEVGATIHLSVNTVKTHVKSIYRKLGVTSRADAISVWRSVHPSPPGE